MSKYKFFYLLLLRLVELEAWCIATRLPSRLLRRNALGPAVIFTGTACPNLIRLCGIRFRRPFSRRRAESTKSRDTAAAVAILVRIAPTPRRRLFAGDPFVMTTAGLDMPHLL